MYFRIKCNFAIDLRNNMSKDVYQPIYAALAANNLTDAQELVNQAIVSYGENAQLYYLQGKVYMKQSAWTKAISSFLKAEELEPEGPAKECRLMLIDIMEFYNKDMFNQ